MEYLAYCLIGIVALCWFAAMLFGLIMAFPLGILGLVGIVGFGILFVKVLVERVDSKEDDYYSKKFDK